MQRLAKRAGNGPVVIPDRFVHRYRMDGWTIGPAPRDLEPVEQPTPLIACQRIQSQPEPEPAPEPEPKRTRTKRRTTKRST